jgi:hypothetical protein
VISITGLFSFRKLQLLSTAQIKSSKELRQMRAMICLSRSGIEVNSIHVPLQEDECSNTGEKVTN